MKVAFRADPDGVAVVVSVASAVERVWPSDAVGAVVIDGVAEPWKTDEVWLGCQVAVGDAAASDAVLDASVAETVVVADGSDPVPLRGSESLAR